MLPFAEEIMHCTCHTDHFWPNFVPVRTTCEEVIEKIIRLRVGEFIFYLYELEKVP